MIKDTLDYIVPKTPELNRVYIPDESVRINYSAIFCHGDDEYKQFNKEASEIGSVIENTLTGPLYKFHEPLQTPAGPLWLLKVRKPDSTHPQRGDADFTLKDYYLFKQKHLRDTEHFKVIDRGHFEMIELRDERFDVFSYFSNTPLTIQLDIK